MTLIISPWVFYLMQLTESVSIAVWVCVASIACIWFCKFIIESGDYKPGTASKILVTVLVLIGIFIPSEATLTKMLIAQNVTYERVEMVGDTVEDVYNDIMSLFNKEDAKE